MGCIFIKEAFLAEGSTPPVGVTTFELLGLQVDLTTGERKPLELLLLQATAYHS